MSSILKQLIVLLSLSFFTYFVFHLSWCFIVMLHCISIRNGIFDRRRWQLVPVLADDVGSIYKQMLTFTQCHLISFHFSISESDAVILSCCHCLSVHCDVTALVHNCCCNLHYKVWPYWRWMHTWNVACRECLYVVWPVKTLSTLWLQMLVWSVVCQKRVPIFPSLILLDGWFLMILSHQTMKMFRSSLPTLRSTPLFCQISLSTQRTSRLSSTTTSLIITRWCLWNKPVFDWH